MQPLAARGVGIGLVQPVVDVGQVIADGGPGLLGLAVNLVTRLVERRVLHWHPSVRKEGAA